MDDFPKYHMVVGGVGKFYSLQEAAGAFSNDMVSVELGELVLETDFSTRPITRQESDRIRDIADSISASK